MVCTPLRNHVNPFLLLYGLDMRKTSSFWHMRSFSGKLLIFVNWSEFTMGWENEYLSKQVMVEICFFANLMSDMHIHAHNTATWAYFLFLGPKLSKKDQKWRKIVEKWSFLLRISTFNRKRSSGVQWDGLHPAWEPCQSIFTVIWPWYEENKLILTHEVIFWKIANICKLIWIHHGLGKWVSF